jgi:UPF0271 protein
MQIDLNCDMGEGFGRWSLGDDEALLGVVTSANVACGLHAGDPQTMRATLRLARERGVAVGAHPAYPDLQGFGRRAMALSPAEVRDCVLYQLGALAAFARAEGVPLRHVKPHGALYNVAARDPATAEAIAQAVAEFDRALVLVGLAGSLLVDAGRALGLAVAEEAFADRAYEPDGSLRDRRLPGALLPSHEAAVAQALSIARHGAARAYSGETVRLRADTLCIHGDTPGAPAFARAVRAALEAAGVAVRGPRADG